MTDVFWFDDYRVKCHVCEDHTGGFNCAQCKEEVCEDCVGPVDCCLLCLAEALDAIDTFVDERTRELTGRSNHLGKT